MATIRHCKECGRPVSWMIKSPKRFLCFRCTRRAKGLSEEIVHYERQNTRRIDQVRSSLQNPLTEENRVSWISDIAGGPWSSSYVAAVK